MTPISRAFRGIWLHWAISAAEGHAGRSLDEIRRGRAANDGEGGSQGRGRASPTRGISNGSAAKSCRPLTDVCHVDEELAAQVGEDILARAESYAALDDTARNVLISPFAEEVAGYEPAGSSLDLKGAVAVVVRSSLLEEAHSHGPVEAGGIQGITTMAAAPLSHFLAARRRTGERWRQPVRGPGRCLPRAWACLGAVALA